MACMSKRIRRLGVALAIGVLATIAMTIYPLAAVDRGHTAKIAPVFRGVYGWFNARDYAFGLEWSNLSLMTTTLGTPLYDGNLPPWGEPPPPPYPPAVVYRVGTLASGWPMRTIAFRWKVSSMKQSFPVPAELDDQDTSIINAAEDVLQKNRAGGPTEWTLLWPPAIANVVFYAAIVLGPIGLLLRLARHSAGKSGKSSSTST